MAVVSHTQTSEPHSAGGLIALGAAERELAAALASRLRHSDPRAVLLEIEGQPVALPEPFVTALAQLADQLGHGRTLSLVVHRATLTPQQAANLINVSRPHLMKLVREGKLHATKVGTHHRLALEEVLQYRASRDAEFEAGMDELSRLAEGLTAPTGGNAAAAGTLRARGQLGGDARRVPSLTRGTPR